MARLRQAVVVARDLDSVASRLRHELGLGEPFSDPGVAHFGLRNAVFALDGTFLEVVSPVSSDAAAARLLERRGGDCGYMMMFELARPEFEGARERAAAAAVREVFEVSLPDMVEVHLHPADMRGAIVSVSAPDPPSSWRWGGPDWEARSAPVRVAGATVAVRDPEAVANRWRTILGSVPGIRFVRDESEPGLVEVVVASAPGSPFGSPFECAGVRFVFADKEEEQP